MKKCDWKIQEYWRNDLTDIENHMNQMSRKGYEVFKISELQSRAELSHDPTDQECLTDGDHFSISTTTRIYYRK